MELKQLIDALNQARERLGDDAKVVIDIHDVDTDLPMKVTDVDIRESTAWLVTEDPE